MKEKVFSVTIADCEVQTFRSGGKGGQHQNKTESGVRIIHHPSGAVAECREERDQLQNKKKAFRKMAESKEFQLWIKAKTASIIYDGPSVEDRVNMAMSPENLKTEVKDRNGLWVKASEEDLNG